MLFPSLLMFLTVTLGIAASYHLLCGLLFPDAERIRRRLTDEFKKDGSQPQSTLFKNLDDMTLLGSPATVATPATLQGRVQELLQQANLTLSIVQLAMISGGLGLLLGTTVMWFAGPLLGVCAAIVGCAAPMFVVYLRRDARREKLLNQLPNAFDLMARVLRAGQSVPQALQAVVDGFEDPLASEFASCQRQQNLGLRPEVTFQEMAARSGIIEMRIFVMAMNVQRQSGGNLSQVLERLATIVRARLRLRKQVRTLTAEGRLQGWSLVVLPFVVLAAMLIVNRDYAMVLFEHTSLLLATCVSMLVGILWIGRIVNFDY